MSANTTELPPTAETVLRAPARPTLSEYAGSAAAIVISAVSSATIVNEWAPPVVHPVRGVASTVRLSIHKGAEVNLGTIGIHAPHAMDNLAVGVQANLTRFPLKLNGSQNTFEAIATLTNHLPNIADQAQSVLIERLAEGAGTGAAIGGYAAYRIGRSLRERGFAERLRSISLLKRTMAVAGMAITLGGVAYNKDLEPDDSIVRAPLPEFVTDHDPKLKDAYTTGIDPENLNDAARSYDYVKNYMTGTPGTKKNTTSIENFTAAYTKAQRTFLGRLNNNSDLITVTQLGDIHCYYPMIPYLRAVLTQIGPKIIIEDGDLGTNSGQAPYEINCIPDEIKTVKAAAAANRIIIHVVRVNGNHDAKISLEISEPEIKIHTLRGNSNTATIHGLTFVGEDDPRRTVWSTVPSGIAETNRALALQGNKIATTACHITKKTHKAPFVVSHSVEGSDEALLKGCTAIAFNGHTHHNGPINIFYGRNGLKEYQHEVGTATGVSAGITIYQKPSLDSTITTWYIDKHTREPVAAVTNVLHPDGSAAIINQPLNGDPQIPSASP